MLDEFVHDEPHRIWNAVQDLLVTTERRGILSTCLHDWRSVVELSRRERGAALFDSMAEQLQAAQLGRLTADKRCSAFLESAESREKLLAVQTVFYHWHWTMSHVRKSIDDVISEFIDLSSTAGTSLSRSQSYCPPPRAPNVLAPPACAPSAASAAVALTEAALQPPMSYCPARRATSPGPIRSASPGSLATSAGGGEASAVVAAAAPITQARYPVRSGSVSRRQLEKSPTMPAIPTFSDKAGVQRSSQRQPLGDCTLASDAQSGHQNVTSTLSGGDQSQFKGGDQPQLKGPERFFYDKKSYTGCSRYGGPTTVDKKENYQSGGMRPRGTIGAPGHGSPRLSQAVGASEPRVVLLR